MSSTLTAPLIDPDARAEREAAERRAEQAGTPSRAAVHRAIAPYARPSSFLGYRSFVLDLLIYGGGITLVLLSGHLAGQLLGMVLAGSGLVNLGSLSHEAAHRAVVRSRFGNKLIAVVSLTMILFNYRLWIYDHHVLHHGRTNVKHNNFLSPLTLAEYQARSPLRRAIYRAYHSGSGAGILLYYLLERWPTVHFVPGAWLPARFRRSAWGYAGLMVAWTGALLTLLVTVAGARHESVALVVMLGFVVPYLAWFTTFSMTAFLQHTNPRLRWYRDVASVRTPPEALSVRVVVPTFINHMTHYVLEHPVHHLTAMVPHYRLKQAQEVLAGLADRPTIVMPFTIANLKDVLARCKLYDYDAHVWRDFAGNVSGIPDDTARANAALLPDRADTSAGVFFPQAMVPPQRAGA